MTDDAQNLIPGALSWDAAKTKVTFNPTQVLAPSTTYTVTVNSGTLAAPVQWSFLTVEPDGIPDECPCTLFDDSDQPASGPENDAAGVKLGTAFKPAQNGQVTAVRFYKRFEDVGPHTVNLWSGSTKVAEAVTERRVDDGVAAGDLRVPAAGQQGHHLRRLLHLDRALRLHHQRPGRPDRPAGR